ncbi:MAG: DUF58 domain-containing protein, partial [Anaerolineales bacterium]|nr:DUF58 domain-containing protein [Anaerolineales bacterium]
MAANYVPLLLLLIVIAAFFQDDFSFTLLYFFAGAFALGNWWSRYALRSIRYKRKFTQRVFLGEEVQVDLEIINLGWLPVPWVRIHEGLPVELSGPDSFQRVTNLGPREQKTFSYVVEARRRGYYPIGPIFFSSADILGLSTSDLRREGNREHLTVYPKIVPLTHISFPSRSPLGTLRHYQPIFEDPTRVMGKREYIAGDSLRRVDWKSTAVTGRMQVKLFEPSIALETVIFLNLNSADYHFRTRIASTELAIVLAASIANWVVEKKQTAGLYVHGKDPLGEDGLARFIPARSGRGHLMRILEVLARIQVDLTNSLDHEWEIDVRKSKATLPSFLKSEFKRIAKTARDRA